MTVCAERDRRHAALVSRQRAPPAAAVNVPDPQPAVGAAGEREAGIGAQDGCGDALVVAQTHPARALGHATVQRDRRRYVRVGGSSRHGSPTRSPPLQIFDEGQNRSASSKREPADSILYCD